MAIDFENPENRRNYLSEKLDDLLGGINDSYGTVLMDELISRLEKTVGDFNDEVNQLMERLRARSEKKEQLLEKLRSDESVEPREETEAPKEAEKEVSKWEKRLEAMDKS